MSPWAGPLINALLNAHSSTGSLYTVFARPVGQPLKRQLAMLTGGAARSLLVLTPLRRSNPQTKRVQLNESLSIRLVVGATIGLKRRNVLIKQRIL